MPGTKWFQLVIETPEPGKWEVSFNQLMKGVGQKPTSVLEATEPFLLHSTSPLGPSLATHIPILFPFPEIPVPPNDLPLILCLNSHFDLKKTASRRCRHWWSRGRRRPPTPNIQALAHSTVGQSLPIPLKKPFPSISSITRPLLFFKYEGNFIQKFQYELSTKRVLNTMIIGAHVLLGQILQNHMLDLLIHNSKLLCILQVIHFPQPLLDDMQEAPIFHVQAAHEKEQITCQLPVIPIALLSLLFQCSNAPSPRPRHT
ncbi:hypothetical protein MJT46_003239 [Ovis ammon polii x Ovis aries]|nr:hypothetical protein MJT46_003239 [Ovis ammon polii x Ovis aries]